MKSLRFISLMGLVGLFTGCGGPSDAAVKNIAYQYMGSMMKNLKESEIRINNSYENNGKTVMILEIRNMICEMPMIETQKGWQATGINCS